LRLNYGFEPGEFSKIGEDDALEYLSAMNRLFAPLRYCGPHYCNYSDLSSAIKAAREIGDKFGKGPFIDIFIKNIIEPEYQNAVQKYISSQLLGIDYFDLPVSRSDIIKLGGLIGIDASRVDKDLGDKDLTKLVASQNIDLVFDLALGRAKRGYQKDCDRHLEILESLGKYAEVDISDKVANIKSTLATAYDIFNDPAKFMEFFDKQTSIVKDVTANIKKYRITSTNFGDGRIISIHTRITVADNAGKKLFHFDIAGKNPLVFDSDKATVDIGRMNDKNPLKIAILNLLDTLNR
jgi:hypothetical protein